jgi:hypothetical protein
MACTRIKDIRHWAGAVPAGFPCRLGYGPAQIAFWGGFKT